jgi:hypothetical protein
MLLRLSAMEMEHQSNLPVPQMRTKNKPCHCDE